jgi:hypothetical protein
MVGDSAVLLCGSFCLSKAAMDLDSQNWLQVLQVLQSSFPIFFTWFPYVSMSFLPHPIHCLWFRDSIFSNCQALQSHQPNLACQSDGRN